MAKHRNDAPRPRGEVGQLVRLVGIALAGSVALSAYDVGHVAIVDGTERVKTGVVSYFTPDESGQSDAAH
jgi:hypothetical protein